MDPQKIEILYTNYYFKFFSGFDVTSSSDTSEDVRGTYCRPPQASKYHTITPRNQLVRTQTMMGNTPTTFHPIHTTPTPTMTRTSSISHQRGRTHMFQSKTTIKPEPCGQCGKR